VPEPTLERYDWAAGRSRRTGFFDVDTGGEMTLELRRSGNEFQIMRRFGYWDARYPEPFIVPADPLYFRTDLATIPPVFSWLIPTMGMQLPAALVHDALVTSDGELPTHDGPSVSREEADRIFRDALKHIGTPVVRRWLIWSGAALGTIWVTARPRPALRLLTVFTLVAAAVLGCLTVLDLFDAVNVLPWMASRPWWAELPLGLAATITIPLAISVLWSPRWRIGAITGVAGTLLAPITVAITATSAAYYLVEMAASSRHGLSPDVASSLARQD